MLADFAVRLALGLAALLLFTSWRVVPLSFFRTHCLVILGLLILAALDTSRVQGLHGSVWLLVAGAVLSYAATVSWGLGLPRVAIPATSLVTLGALYWLALASQADPLGVWLFNTASRCASGWLMGATLTAMLLGHQYLIAPTMSIEPLKGYVRCVGWGLAARGLIALAGLSLAHSGLAGLSPGMVDSSSPLFLTMRWAVGFLGPVVASILAWKTVQIRSTQSATGILYVALTLVLFGELTSLIGARAGGLCG
ncbi:MAG: hypothetical protein ACP5XB_02995 [Isosphaeraceae bacterium]